MAANYGLDSQTTWEVLSESEVISKHLAVTMCLAEFSKDFYARERTLGGSSVFLLQVQSALVLYQVGKYSQDQSGSES